MFTQKFSKLLLIISIVSFASIMTSAQNTDQVDDIIKIDTDLSRVNIYIPQNKKRDFNWVLKNGNNEIKDFQVVEPRKDVPLELTVVCDFQQRKINGLTYNDINSGLKMLNEEIILTSNTQVFTNSTDKSLKLPSGWDLHLKTDLRASLDSAVEQLRKSNNSRQGLIVLTDKYEELPANIVELLDNRLKHTSSVVFVISVKNKLSDGIVGRSNINGDTLVTPSEKYLRSVFKSSLNLLNNVYTVWFPLPETKQNTSLYQVRIEARDALNNLVSANQRDFYTR